MEEHNEFYELVNKVQPLAKSWTRSRSGFGYFRHNPILFLHTAKLIIESGITLLPELISIPILIERQNIFSLTIHSKISINYRSLFENFLVKPETFNPHRIWALFWAISIAEHQFMLNYTPFWSHEERLTGQFVGQIIDKLDDFGIYWRQLTEIAQPLLPEMRIYYADTATASRETVTGADIGLIIQARYENQSEFFKVARFQAKKVENGRATIDLQQLNALLRHKGLGYFLFYHRFDIQQWTPAPTVKPADAYQEELNKFNKERNADINSKRNLKVIENIEDYESLHWDFASFITFGLADIASDYGIIKTRAEEAINLLMGIDEMPLNKPSRIMIITIGNNISVVDWNQLLREYL
jgi:hypothetical protein